METEFVKTTSFFLSTASLTHASNLFQSLLYNEQLKRNAHIHCLPSEIKFHILFLMYDQCKLKVFRNIKTYRDIFGRNDLAEIKDETYKERYEKLNNYAEILLASFRLTFSSYCYRSAGFALVILAQCHHMPALPYTGTNKGRHILAIIENDQSYHLLQDSQDLLLSAKEPFSIQIHRCALQTKHRANPFTVNESTEEYIAIKMKDKIHKIWWVDAEARPSGIFHI